MANRIFKAIAGIALSLSLLFGGVTVVPSAQANSIFDGEWKYGDTVTGPYGLITPANWITIESVPARFPDFYGRAVLKYIGGAPFGAVEGALSFFVPDGWVVIGKGYQDRTPYQVIKNLNSDSVSYHGLTETILDISPIPKNWVIIQKNGDTKTIKKLTKYYSNLYDTERVTTDSPLPKGWFTTEIGLDYKKITSVGINTIEGRQLTIISSIYDQSNGVDEWLATEKTSNGYVLTYVGSFAGHPDNVTHKFRALKGTYVPDRFWVEDYGDPQYVNICIRVSD